MAKGGGREVMVGTFATLALIVLAIAIMTIGGESPLRRGAEYSVVFPHTDGLRPGSPVKMSGVVVGSVREILLPTDPASMGIQVRLSIDPTYAPRVKSDSKAALEYLQILSGEKYVEISPGSPTAAALEEGATLAHRGEKELFEQGADIAGNINEITLSLRNILGPIERGEGLLGQLVYDPEFGKEGLASLKASLQNLEAITARLKSGRGFVGRLLADEGFGSKVDQIAVSLDALAALLEQARAGQGALGALLAEDGAGKQAIEDLRLASASIRRSAERLEAKEGLVGRLLNDPEYSEGLATDLKLTLRNLQEVTTKINRGQGTIGALVNERVLHDSLEEVVAGVNDSKFARWLMRHYQKKGIELSDEAAPVPQQAPAPGEDR